MKKKVRWSDGHPVTAKDLEYSYEIIANPKVKTSRYVSSLENIKGIAAYHAGKAKNISGIEMPDGPNGRRIILHFFELRPAMLSAGNVFFWDYAAPYHYLKNIPFDKLVSSPQIRKHPLFFGPYKMDSTVQGQATTWSRNPYYWQGKPNFEHIQMSTISTSSASQAIKSRKFDVANVINMQYAQVKNTKGINIIGNKSTLYSYLSFKVGKWNENTGKNEQYKHAKMDNPALRKAMAYGMNVDQVDQRIFHSLRYRVNSLIPAQFGAYHDKNIPAYSYNPAKANKLLDQAGYKKDKKTGYRLQPNGKKLTINLAVPASSSSAASLWTNYIQQWKKLGLKVRFYTGRPMEFNNWVNAVKASDPGIDVLSNAWEPTGNPSPTVLYGKKMPYNAGRFVSPTNNKLLSEIDSKKSFDTNYRIQKMHEWQRWMYDKAYVVLLSGTYSLVALDSKLIGWSLKPSANVWFEAGFSKK